MLNLMDINPILERLMKASKKKSILLLFLLVAMISSAQSFGTHVQSSRRLKLSIDSTRLVMLYPNTIVRTYFDTDTLAICSYQPVSGSLICVSSLETRKMAQDSAWITYSYDAALEDSLRFIFEIGSCCVVAKWLMNKSASGAGKADTCSFYLDPGENVYTIPRKDYLSIGRLWFVSHDNSGFLDFGGNNLYPQYVRIKNDHQFVGGENVIHVKAPYVSSEFFDRLQIYKEYMYLSADTIKWRGLDFIRDNKMNKPPHKKKRTIYPHKI